MSFSKLYFRSSSKLSDQLTCFFFERRSIRSVGCSRLRSTGGRRAPRSPSHCQLSRLLFSDQQFSSNSREMSLRSFEQRLIYHIILIYLSYQEIRMINYFLVSTYIIWLILFLPLIRKHSYSRE